MPTFIIRQLLDSPNRNGRIYTKECMEKAITDTKKLIEEKRFLGELLEQSQYTGINLSNVSHMVTDLRIEENKIAVDIQVLKTPKGILLQEMMDAKEIEFVQRGLGKIGKDNIVTDYTLIAIDAVRAYHKNL